MTGAGTGLDANYHEEHEYADDEPEDECWNCGGEGVIYSCFEEYACIDPEGGCDLCSRRCDVCRP
jgi:hypothetical protein